MLKKHLEKKKKLHRKMVEAYNRGYEKASAEKDQDIKALKQNYRAQLEQKDKDIHHLIKRVQKIDASLDSHSCIIDQTNAVLKKIKTDSYAKSMLSQEEHRKVETMNDEIEILKLKMNKSKHRLDAKIIEFRRIVNE